MLELLLAVEIEQTIEGVSLGPINMSSKQVKVVYNFFFIWFYTKNNNMVIIIIEIHLGVQCIGSTKAFIQEQTHHLNNHN